MSDASDPTAKLEATIGPVAGAFIRSVSKSAILGHRLLPLDRIGQPS